MGSSTCSNSNQVKESVKMHKNHKIVVTMTSWKKRIGNCA